MMTELEAFRKLFRGQTCVSDDEGNLLKYQKAPGEPWSVRKESDQIIKDVRAAVLAAPKKQPEKSVRQLLNEILTRLDKAGL